MMLSEEKIQSVVERIVQVAQPSKVILFGSYARGNANENSDLDLMVIEPHVADSGREMVRLRIAIGSIGMRAVVIEQLYLATGQPRLLGLAGVPRVITLAVGVPIGYSLGQLNGALVAIVVSQFVQWPQAIWYRRRLRLNDYRNDLMLPAAFAAGCALGWLAVHTFSEWSTP